jgi:hypothetical protein
MSGRAAHPPRRAFTLFHEDVTEHPLVRGARLCYRLRSMILRLSPVAPLLAAAAMRAALALTAGETAQSDGVGGANGSGAVAMAANGTGAGTDPALDVTADPAAPCDRADPARDGIANHGPR